MTLLIGIVFLSACNKGDLPEETLPECIAAKIKILQAEDVWNPPASIWQYEYNGQVVYFIPQHCCDMQSILLDGNCKTVCIPDGGITGKGDGTCPDFFSSRKNEKLIWQDEGK